GRRRRRQRPHARHRGRGADRDPAGTPRCGDGDARDTRRAAQHPDMTLPTGTIPCRRTDGEGSMRHARALGPGWDAVNARHISLIRTRVVGSGGTIVRTEGDAIFAVFPEAISAVTAAADAQRALTAEAWPGDDPIRVRMGLHTGEAHLAGDDYGGFDVNRAARVAAAGHGGQVVLSETTAT